MSLTNIDDETNYMIKKAMSPWAGRVVDRQAAEAALAEHFERLGLKPYPVEWAPDGAYGYIEAFRTGGIAMGMTNDPDWLREHKRLNATGRERVWDKTYTVVYNEVVKAWSQDDEFVVDRMFANAQREMGSKLSRLRRRRTTIPTDSVARFMAQGIAWSALYARNDDAVADNLSRVWMPFFDMYEAGVWFCWIVNGKAIMVERPSVYKDTIGRFHRVDGPAVDWNNGEGLFYWSGVEVNSNLVLHPETITPRMIDNERNVEVRRVMIERFGLDKYVSDFSEVVHKDHRGTLLRKNQVNDEPIVVVKVKNSSPEPDGTFKDYFIRVPPHINNASHAIAWTFGIEPEDYYDPMVET
jgi:hypothetical protein